MSLNKAQHGAPYSVTATNATSSVATKAAITGSTHYITDICGSSDKAAAQILVKDGTTVIWQGQISQTAAGVSIWSQTFETPLQGTPGNAVSVTVDSTAYGSANIAGFTL